MGRSGVQRPVLFSRSSPRRAMPPRTSFITSLSHFGRDDRMNAPVEPASDARLMLRRWTDIFLLGFDMAHPPSPAEQAAGILRTSFCNPPALDDLARQTATSRSALARDFRRRYGFSRGEYLTRVRLRWFIAQIRGTDRNATRAAREAGYESYHNMVEALKLRTGLTPTEVRRLDCGHVDGLLNGPLALGRPGPSPTAVGFAVTRIAASSRASISTAPVS